MGMFDEITVGRTYLKDLLTKEQEAIIKQGDDIYQTKDLKNLLGSYKIYKRKPVSYTHLTLPTKA